MLSATSRARLPGGTCLVERSGNRRVIILAMGSQRAFIRAGSVSDPRPELVPLNHKNPLPDKTGKRVSGFNVDDISKVYVSRPTHHAIRSMTRARNVN